MLTGAVLVATLGMAEAKTVFQDDFEAETVALTTGLSKWIIAAGSIDVIGTDYFAFYGPGRYLDMNGSTSNGGRIEKALTGLIVGQEYTLHFDYGVNPSGATTQETLAFGLGGFTGVIDILRPIASLVSVSYSFKATATSATLFFADAGDTDGDNGGPVLDNVALSTVPLPASAPMLLAAVGGFGLLRRRRAAV